MGRVVTGVTLDTLSQVVNEAGIEPGETFTLVLDDGRRMSREDFLQKADALTDKMNERMARDGITTPEQKEALVESIMRD